MTSATTTTMLRLARIISDSLNGITMAFERRWWRKKIHEWYHEKDTSRIRVQVLLLAHLNISTAGRISLLMMMGYERLRSRDEKLKDQATTIIIIIIVQTTAVSAASAVSAAAPRDRRLDLFISGWL